MTTLSEYYAGIRGRVTDLVHDAGERAATPVPTCPAWSVHDVLAHMVGVCADIVNGNIEGAATDAWTAAHVDARRDRSIADLLAEWDEVGPPVEASVDAFPGRVGSQMVFDATTHEHDIRLGLGAPGARDLANIEHSLEFLLTVLVGPSVTVRGLGPLEIRAGDRRWVTGTAPEPGGGITDPEGIAARAGALGVELLTGSADPAEPSGEPVAAVTAPAFELVRAISGRRSAAQIAGFDWSVDPAPYVEAFVSPPFSMTPDDIVE